MTKFRIQILKYNKASDPSAENEVLKTFFVKSNDEALALIEKCLEKPNFGANRDKNDKDAQRIMAYDQYCGVYQKHWQNIDAIPFTEINNA